MLERAELELALKSDARLDAVLENLLEDLELRLLLLTRDEELEEDLEPKIELELLEREEEDDVMFSLEARIFLSFFRTGFSSMISSSLRLICLTSLCAAFEPTTTSSSSFSTSSPSTERIYNCKYDFFHNYCKYDTWFTIFVHQAQILFFRCSLGMKETAAECFPASLYRRRSEAEAMLFVATFKQPFSPMATALAQYFFSNLSPLGFLIGSASATILSSEDWDCEKKYTLIVL